MFNSGLTYQKTITIVTEICCNCGIAFGIPSDFQDQCKVDPKKYFYCPNGHGQHYSKSAEVIKREQIENELRKAQQHISNLQVQKIQVDDLLNKANKQLKRVHNGVCPCCNRSFTNLQQHMKKQHPNVEVKK